MLADGPSQHLLHPGDDLIEVENFRPNHFSAREGEQLPGEVRRPLGRLGDLLVIADRRLDAFGPVGFGRSDELLGDERCIVEDHGEEIVEVVGDPAGELSQAL